MPRTVMTIDAVHAPPAVEFRARIRLGSRSDVTVNASNPGVRRSIESNEFGFHYRVAGLPAEFHRLTILVSTIAAEGAHENKEERNAHERERYPALTRIV